MLLSTEYFSSELKTVTCDTKNSLSMAFTSQETYQRAVQNWNWVNFNEQRSFILIVNSDGCSPESERQPWVVNGVNYDDSTFTAHFNATQEKWRALAVGFLIQWGQSTTPATSNPPTKREPWDNPFSGAKSKADSVFSKATSMVESKVSSVEVKASSVVSQVTSAVVNALPTKTTDAKKRLKLDHTIDSTLLSKTTKSGLEFSIDCEGCSIKGDLSVEGYIEANVTSIQAMAMKVTTSGIEVDANLAAKVSGTLGSGWNDTHVLGNIPVDGAGFSIPGVFNLGPEVSLLVGYSLSGIHGSTTVKSGVTAKIPNTAFASIDFLDSSKSQVDHWKPDISTKAITADAEIDGSLEVYVALTANIDCWVLGKLTALTILYEKSPK